MTCSFHRSARLMKRKLLAALSFSMLIALSATRGQAPDAKDDQKLLALVKEVQAQQGQIAENQAKIEAKLAEVSETIRVARIYTSRER
jgi:NADH:ubiquinone oxidoreductase subunit E